MYKLKCYSTELFNIVYILHEASRCKQMNAHSFIWMNEQYQNERVIHNVNVCWFKYGKHIVSQYLIVILLSELVCLHAVNQYLTICPSLKSKYDDVCQSTWGSIPHTHTHNANKYIYQYTNSILILTLYCVI